MPRPAALEGKRFGRLIAIRRSDSNGQWLCRCDCGNETYVGTSNLNRGNSKSCGCWQKELAREASRRDITGMTFGRLTAVEFVEFGQKGARWRFACVCGNAKIARIDSVTTGNTLSCGCIRAEEVAKSNRLDIAGRRFGKLVAIQPVESRAHSVRWLCQCDCGKKKVGPVNKLTYGCLISCGCAPGNGHTVYSPLRVRQKSIEYASKRRAIKLAIGGAFTQAEVDVLLKRQSGRCAACRTRFTKGRPYERDHKMPLALKGDNSIHNIELLCRPCNTRKNALHPLDWAKKRGMLL